MNAADSVLWKCDRGTRAKLEILRCYLGAWFNILAQGGVKDVVYFDGFCGPGEYEGSEKGSPVVAAELANSVVQKVDNFRVHIICIDKRADMLRHLENMGAIRSHHSRVSIDIRQGEFEREIVAVIGSDQYKAYWPIFSFVDPFGFSDFSRTTLQLLMRNQSSEIFVNLSCGFMNRFLTHPDEQVKKCISDLIGAENLERVARAPDGISEICEIFREQLQKLGRYVQRFMMRDEKNTRDNALFFCGRNEKGLQKIKEAMWKVDPISGASFSEYAAQKGEDGLPLLTVDEPQTSALRRTLVENFSGRSDIPIAELERWTIVETETFLPTHLRRELEKLHELGWITYVDPAPTRRKRQRGHWPSRLLISFRSSNV